MEVYSFLSDRGEKQWIYSLIDLVAADDLDIGQLLMQLIEQAAHGVVADVAGEVDVEHVAPRAVLERTGVDRSCRCRNAR